VPIHAQAYHRSPFEPFPADRTSQRRLAFTRHFTASADVTLASAARVIMKLEATRST
jgi:hypothetical protein